MKKIWIDITNTPHVNLLMPIISHLKSKHELLITARNFSETVPLLKRNGISPIVLGEYKGKSRLRKVIGLVDRINELRKAIPYFDISLSLGGNYTATISKFRKKPSIVMSDNDISFKVPSYKFGTYFILPSYFDKSSLIKKYKVKSSQIHVFNGFKENIYIADFEPDKSFLDKLPFEQFITIRPENLKASYVPQNSTTIVPDLFNIFKNENILFLPRYEEEKKFAQGYKNVFIPQEPLSGLDVCFYTKAMLTGAGTFAREAAILGTPSVSFFPGNIFLTVDKIMQEKGWEFKSRNPREIFEYVQSAKKRDDQVDNSRTIQKEVLSIFDKLLES